MKNCHFLNLQTTNYQQLLKFNFLCVSSCTEEQKAENKGRKEGRQTRRSLTKLQGGEAIIHQHPHLLKSSQLPAPFKMRVMGALGRIPPTLLSGWLPPTARRAAHLQPLPRQHIIISDLHTGGGGGHGEGEGRAATVNSN